MVRHIHGSYWDQLWECMDYWIRTGDSEADALAKAYWWDCVEVWNFDHSWDDEKQDGLSSLYSCSLIASALKPESDRQGMDSIPCSLSQMDRRKRGIIS